MYQTPSRIRAPPVCPPAPSRIRSIEKGVFDHIQESVLYRPISYKVTYMEKIQFKPTLEISYRFHNLEHVYMFMDAVMLYNRVLIDKITDAYYCCVDSGMSNESVSAMFGDIDKPLPKPSQMMGKFEAGYDKAFYRAGIYNSYTEIEHVPYFEFIVSRE